MKILMVVGGRGIEIGLRLGVLPSSSVVEECRELLDDFIDFCKGLLLILEWF